MSIKNKILDVIERKTFISLEEFMHISLHDKEFGYYKNSKPLGANGDFVTSPEISQLYGEMVGLWLGQLIITNNIKNFNLVELGPGNGTLISDILRVLKKIFKDTSFIEIHFVENNVHFIKKLNIDFPNAIIHSDIKTIPDEFSIIIANEFFDALPVMQIKKDDKKFKKLVIKKDENGELKEEFILFKNDAAYKYLENLELKNGDIYEISNETDSIIELIAKKIKVFGGFVLFADYGYSQLKLKSTLSSMKNNKTTNFLDNLGEQDLTAHVNFMKINEIFKDHRIKNLKTVKQSEFLKELGIELRASKLIESNPVKEKEILLGLNRLIGLDEMGSLLKVIYSDYK